MVIALVILGAYLVFAARQQGTSIFSALEPPPAPAVPTAPWANAFSGGASVGIAGPDASAYVPLPVVGAPPAFGTPWAGGATQLANPFAGAALALAGPSMGGASWDAPVAGQPLAGQPAPTPVLTPTTETRSGKGHF